MIEGYFIMHRKLLKSDIGKDPMKLFVFCHLLARANFEPTNIDWDGKPTVLPRGGLLLSKRALADQIGISRNTLKSVLDYLVDRRTIKVDHCGNGSRVVFYKYEQYQSHTKRVAQPLTRGGSVSGSAIDPQVGQPLTPHKELNNTRTRHRAEKSQSVPVRPSSLENMIEILGQEYCLDLSKTFPDKGYLAREMGKAYMWFKDQPKKNLKTPGGWRRTITSWMSRGWDRHANAQPKKQTTMRFADV